MKKLGLVGGMGPESTLAYYHDINYAVKDALGRNCFPEMAVESVNLFKVTGFLEEKRYEETAQYLAAAVNNLAHAGAEMAALTANTAHIVFDRVQELSQIPLTSIVTATVDEAKRLGYSRLGLLGTIFTMENDFFKAPFANSGIEIATPSPELAQRLSHHIYTELEHGIVRESTRRFMLDLLSSMQRNQGIDAAILGCTELPMIFDGTPTPLPTLDTRAIHIRALTSLILS